MILVNLAFILLVLFTVAVREHSSIIQDEEEYRMVKDMAYSIAEEFVAVTSVEDGVIREFTIPNRTGEYPISAWIDGASVVVNTSSHEYIVSIPSVQGQLHYGTNTINKTDGIIYVY